MTKKAKVKLVNSTPKPVETMCWARRVMHAPVPDSIHHFNGFGNGENYLGMSVHEYFNKVLLKDRMPTFLEYVTVTFKLENVSRALQQQLTRHRIGFSYSIQSLRCVDIPNFAKDGAYYNPYKADSEKYWIYQNYMEVIQVVYTNALSGDMPTQDARGLLPMNIHSTITFSCNLRALVGMVSKRLCNKTQGEFREVAAQIVTQVCELDNRLKSFFKRPCDQGKCMMEGENQIQYDNKQLEGEQNTDHTCPIFVKKFCKG